MLCRKMLRCSDIVPGSAWSAFAGQFNLDDPNLLGEDYDGPVSTYGSIARWLLENPELVKA